METQPTLPHRDNRPWGDSLTFTHNEPSTVKILIVNAGEAFSLQYHRHREEFWHVISGDGTIEIGDTVVPVRPGDDHVIPAGTNHRISAGTSPVVVLEISKGEFDENDITRLEDRYGRL